MPKTNNFNPVKLRGLKEYYSHLKKEQVVSCHDRFERCLASPNANDKAKDRAAISLEAIEQLTAEGCKFTENRYNVGLGVVVNRDKLIKLLDDLGKKHQAGTYQGQYNAKDCELLERIQEMKIELRG